MKIMKKYLKDKYYLSNYQIAQLCFLFKTLFSEISKIIIMGILFLNHLPAYFFGLFVMLFLRYSTGGLHFYTYAGCLLTSILYIALSIRILPNISLPIYLQLLLLLLCIIICYRIGPIVSKYRPTPSQQLFVRGRNTTCTFIFIYALAIYIIPANHLMTAGFWTIILHSLQLIVAKIRQKGDNIK